MGVIEHLEPSAKFFTGIAVTYGSLTKKPTNGPPRNPPPIPPKYDTLRSTQASSSTFSERSKNK